MVVLNSSKIVSVEFKNCSSILITGSSLYFPANNVTWQNSQIVPQNIGTVTKVVTSFVEFSAIDVGDGLYLYDLLVKTVTVMLVTSLCWWLYDGDWFEMLMAESLCWRLFSLCWWFCWSPTSQTCHQRGVGCSWQIGSWPAHVRLLFTVNNTFGLQYPSPTSMWPLKLSLL